MQVYQSLSRNFLSDISLDLNFFDAALSLKSKPFVFRCRSYEWWCDEIHPPHHQWATVQQLSVSDLVVIPFSDPVVVVSGFFLSSK